MDDTDVPLPPLPTEIGIPGNDGNRAAHRICSKHRRTGEPCKAFALAGTDYCWYHGGASATATGHAQQKKALIGAQLMSNTYGEPVAVDPVTGLLEEVARTNGHIKWLQEKLLTEDPDEFAEHAWRRSAGEANNTTRGPTARDMKHMPKAYAAVWLDLYQRERQHFLKACVSAVGANAAERFARLMDAQGELIGLAIRRILEDLTLTEEQQEIAMQSVPRHLREITTGQAA